MKIHRQREFTLYSDFALLTFLYQHSKRLFQKAILAVGRTKMCI